MWLALKRRRPLSLGGEGNEQYHQLTRREETFFSEQNVPMDKGPTHKKFLKLHLLAKIKP